MKKLFYLSIFVGYFGFSQKNVLYLDGSLSTGTNIGLSFEKLTNEKIGDYKISNIFKVQYSSGTLTNSNPNFKDINGKGYVLEVGARLYFNKKAHKGFFAGLGFGGGYINFENNNFYNFAIYGGDGKFSGEYRYFYIPLEIGVKFLITKKVAVNIFGGTNLNMELSATGNVSNSYFDNVVPSLGIAAGYCW